MTGPITPRQKRGLENSRDRSKQIVMNPATEGSLAQVTPRVEARAGAGGGSTAPKEVVVQAKKAIHRLDKMAGGTLLFTFGGEDSQCRLLLHRFMLRSQSRMSTVADAPHLLAGVIHSCQVSERGFQTAVTQQFLDLASRSPSLMPVRRKVFAKPM